MEKKVREHHRKQRREQKKSRETGGIKKRNSKGMTIPNTVPFKDQIIQEAKQLKQHEQERKRLLKGMLKGTISMSQLACDNKPKTKPKKTNKKKSTSTASTVEPTSSAKTESMQCD